MLELAVLGLLKERAMHGYELRKQLTVRLGFFWTVSFGSLYPTLRQMERRGLVEKVRQAHVGGRRKQVYRIAESGEHRFLELLEDSAAATEEDKFPLRLAFFRYLRPETRIRLLERRKAFLEDRVDEGRRRLSRARRGPADTYTLSLMRHGVDVTERDIAWLDELIAAERGLGTELPGGTAGEGDDGPDDAAPPPTPAPPPAADDEDGVRTRT